MTSAHLIEVADEPAGLAVPAEDGFQFFSSDPRFDALHGRIHVSLAELERAIVRIVRKEARAQQSQGRRAA